MVHEASHVFTLLALLANTVSFLRASTASVKQASHSSNCCGRLCRKHSLTLAARTGNQCHLSRMASLLSSLGATAGDQLCFERAGRLAANVTLVKSAAAAAAGGGVAGPGGQAVLEADSEEEEEEEETTQPQRSQATGAESEAGGGGAGWLASRAAPQQDETAVWVEMSLLLKAAEERGEPGLAKAA